MTEFAGSAPPMPGSQVRQTASGQVGKVGQAVRRRGRPGYDLDALVAAATRVFTEYGYDGTTMDRLAADLGISKSAIYHHVPGKQAILERALDRALNALERVLRDATAASEPVAARLERAVRGSVDALVAELPAVTLLLRVRGNSDVERAALARRRRIDADLAALVTEAQRAGAVRADMEPALVARLIFGTVNSLVEWYQPRTGTDPAGLADAVCRLVFGGLRRPRESTA